MSYAEVLTSLLVPRSDDGPLVLDLFAGSGGLALGFEAQGFQTWGFEQDADCCMTYSHNLHGQCSQVTLTPQTDLPAASIIIAGPPCQPFSVGGLQLGLSDTRDGFPSFIAAVEHLKPQLWLFENVRGLFYRNRWYLDAILDQLRKSGPGYIVDVKLFRSADYGVPQNRERIIVVGHLGGFRFPLPQKHRVTAGDALGLLAVDAPPNSKFLTPSMDAYVARYEKASACVRPRDLHLDKPARTLTTRNLAGATGDMLRIRLPDGRRRRLTVREAARLQSFPDWYEFSGTENSQFNQIGNAAPPLLAYHLARSVRNYLGLAPDERDSSAGAAYLQPSLLF